MHKGYFIAGCIQKKVESYHITDQPHWQNVGFVLKLLFFLVDFSTSKTKAWFSTSDDRLKFLLPGVNAFLSLKGRK